jgi:multidrug efflux system outer membrane protein
MTWEIDFWGKYRSLNDAAKAEYLATEYGMQALQISVVTEVINSYFTLLDYKARLDIAQKTLQTRNEYLKIIQQRFSVGYIPEIDLNQAQMQKAIAESAVPLYQRMVAKAENALSVLIGNNPQEILTHQNIFEIPVPEKIPNGLPSELLKRRPDILQAEMQLKAQNERIGAAIAMRFPSISLSGFLGGASNDLSTFVSEGAAWNIGAGLLGPVFNFNKNKRRVQIEKEKTEQALYQYRKTVLYAFKEVEDALVDIKTYNKEIKSRQAHYNAAANAEKLSKQRYDKGVTSYLEVLETQRQAFESALNLSKTKQELLNSYIRLYKAIGGGIVK